MITAAPKTPVLFIVTWPASLAKVVELGGSVTQPAEDTPYGRLAGAVDPTGAPFKLMTPPAS